LSSRTSSMRNNYASESRPVSRATSYIEGLGIEIDESSPYYCKHCGQLKNNLDSILNDPRNYKLPTTPDESHREKEEKSHHNSAPEGRGCGRGKFSRKSVQGYFSYSDSSNHSDGRKSTSDGESFISSSPADSLQNSVYEEPPTNIYSFELAERDRAIAAQ
ncbi:34026_t:CDS:1, partial [Racocetra persica]